MCPLNQQQNQKNKPMFKNISSCRALAPFISQFPRQLYKHFRQHAYHECFVYMVHGSGEPILMVQNLCTHTKRSCYTPLLSHHKTTNKFAQLVFAGPAQKLSITIVLARQTCKTSGLQVYPYSYTNFIRLTTTRIVYRGCISLGHHWEHRQLHPKHDTRVLWMPQPKNEQHVISQYQRFTLWGFLMSHLPRSWGGHFDPRALQLRHVQLRKKKIKLQSA